MAAVAIRFLGRDQQNAEPIRVLLEEPCTVRGGHMAHDVKRVLQPIGQLKPATRAKLDALADGLDSEAGQETRAGPADRRHEAVPRVARRRAHGYHAQRRRVRLAGPSICQSVGGGARDHRHALERAGCSSACGMARHDRDAAPQAPLRGLHPQVHPRRVWTPQFNSLDAQRQAVEAYIPSRPGRGLDRRCLTATTTAATREANTPTASPFSPCYADIEAGKVDVVAVYKIDRLGAARSLDFVKIMEVFNRHGVTFVSTSPNSSAPPTTQSEEADAEPAHELRRV